MRSLVGKVSPNTSGQITVMLIAYVCLLFPSCTGNVESPTEKVTIAEGQQQGAALVYVAKDKGFFRDEGLDVTLQPYSSGKECLAAMLEGKADLATVAETPLVFAAMKEERIFTIATISESSRAMAIVAPGDRRIIAPADLKGKSVGVPIGTNGEYFLHTYLVFHGISERSIRIVDVNPGSMVDALAEGVIDAATAWAPHTTRLQSALGAAGVSFYGEDIYTMTFNLAATQDFARKNPKKVVKFLRAMLRSESFARDYPVDAARIVSSNTGAPAAAVLKEWGTYRYEVTLRQSLLTTMEAQARWAIRDRLSDRKEVPNFLDSFYLDGMMTVKPDAVTVSR
jgi:NitT/TauT family transport system substrate-binding protein